MTTVEHAPSDARPIKRGPRFAPVLALVVGLVSGCQIHAWYDRHRPRVELLVGGQDVDRHGGEGAEAWGRFTSLKQTCRGGCDDVRYVFRTTGEGFPIEVKSGSGRKILAYDAYATSGLPNRYRLGGQDRLDLDFLEPEKAR